MRRLLFRAVLCLTAMSGCGVSDDPTRVNDFTPLTSIEIQSQNPQIAVETSNQFKAIGNFSGQFTRDITAEVTWSSLDETIATIRNDAPSKGLAKGLSAGMVTIVAQLGDVFASIDFEVTDTTIVPPLSVSPAQATLVGGTTLALSATGTFSDGTTQSLTPDVSWTSGDSTLLTVSNDTGSEGQATAVGTVSVDTTVTVTAEFPPSAPLATGTATLTISPAVLEAISVLPASSSLNTLETQQLTASGLFSDGTTPDLTSNVSWSSNNNSLATIDSGGLATALAAGTATISATLNSVTGEATLTVSGSAFQSISLDPLDSTALVGDTVVFAATGNREDGTSTDITTLVTWNSTSTNVATISNVTNSEGEATAITAGETSITAALGNILASTTLTINTP